MSKMVPMKRTAGCEQLSLSVGVLAFPLGHCIASLPLSMGQEQNSRRSQIPHRGSTASGRWIVSKLSFLLLAILNVKDVQVFGDYLLAAICSPVFNVTQRGATIWHEDMKHFTYTQCVSLYTYYLTTYPDCCPHVFSGRYHGTVLTFLILQAAVPKSDSR